MNPISAFTWVGFQRLRFFVVVCPETVYNSLKPIVGIPDRNPSLNSNKAVR